MPLISLSNMSPLFRYSSGDLHAPTPDGVPVNITSPGYKVTILKVFLCYKYAEQSNKQRKSYLL